MHIVFCTKHIYLGWMNQHKSQYLMQHKKIDKAMGERPRKSAQIYLTSGIHFWETKSLIDKVNYLNVYSLLFIVSLLNYSISN